MGCCFCCYSEDAQVQALLEKLPVVKASAAKHDDLTFIVGRVAFVEPPLLAPISHREVAYYELRVEQKKVRRDEEGRETVYWEQIAHEVRSCNFLLTDPDGGPVFVSASNKTMKCYTVEDSHKREVKYSIHRSHDNHHDNHNHHDPMRDIFHRHGLHDTIMNLQEDELRYFEGAFCKDEMVAIFGRVKNGEYSGAQTNFLEPAHASFLTDEYFEKNEWTGIEKKCWESLFETECYIGTDDPKYLKGIYVGSGGALTLPTEQEFQPE